MTESRYARLRNKVAPLGMTSIPNSKLSGMTGGIAAPFRVCHNVIPTERSEWSVSEKVISKSEK